MIATLAFLLAFFNGANDSGKGVATLACSGESRPRGALRWAVLTTLAGALAAVWGGAALAATFSGKGLVPDAVAGTPSFLLAAGAGAVVTVALATALRLPVSTSHALLGGLLGSALGGGVAVDGGALATKFLLPLAFSPL
ncbi:MAG: inorganic phosphate transporter, partial [Planctomycetota bacterium]